LYSGRADDIIVAVIEMFEYIDDLKPVSVVSGISAQCIDFTDRATHVFIFKCSGSSVYRFDQRELVLSQGQAIFIPQGSTYRVEKLSKGESRYVLFNFIGTIKDATPKVYPVQGFAHTDLICGGLERMWLLGDAPERYRCQAVFYDLLAFAARMEQGSYTYAKHREQLRPALEYLQEHLFDSELKAGMLHGLCGVSDTYFRRIFKANFGVGPQEYITNKRLAQAAAMISGGDFESIQQVALSVGFSDPLYFSRVFAHRYGSSPSNYKR